jgi:hypothetical protein
MSNTNISRRGAPIATALLMALVLAACGGGGGNPGSVTGVGGGSTGTGGTVTVGAPASVQFVVAAPADKSIVIKGQGGNGRVETATLTFKVVDTNGNPLANQQVNFTLEPAGSASLNTASGKTSADGTVVAAVSSGSAPTTLRVRATLPGTATAANGNKDISTQSDTITVTTGVGVQTAFSISSTAFQVEGWNIDSAPDKGIAQVQVLLADAFGNPVADGTSIVFQTNAGSVGSADRGGCVTQNGGCSVDFRAQNPRVPTPGQPATPCNTTGSDGKGAGATPDIARPGLATICASSTNGSMTLFDKQEIFLSGSAPVHFYVDSVNKEVDFSTGVGDLGKIDANTTRTISLQVNDINRNPLPANTKLEIGSQQGATVGTPSPATVPGVYVYSSATRDPSGASGYSQGSWHQVRVSAGTPANCTGTQEVDFTLKTTTPGVASTGSGGVAPTVTEIPFKLTVTCP